MTIVSKMDNSHISIQNPYKEIMMRAMIVVAALAFCSGAFAAGEPQKKEPSPAQLAQQEKMKSCNADAGKKELKGDERKKFMSECLKAGK